MTNKSGRERRGNINASTKAQKDAILKKLLSIKEQGTQARGAMKAILEEMLYLTRVHAL
jgi:hypothetical protein